MKIDQLSYFVQVAKLEHLSQAARAVGVSPSAVSHSIAALEEELGRELLRREGKRLTVTSHGRILAKRAESILNQLRHLKEEMASDEVAWEGTLRLGAPHGFAADCLGDAFVELSGPHPELRGELHNLRSAEVMRLVAAGELDYGLTLTASGHHAIERQKLFSGEVLLCVRQQHPILALPATARVAALHDYPVAGPRSVGELANDVDCSVLGYMHQPGVFAFCYDSYDLASQYLLKTDAWSFLPDWAIQSTHGVIVAIPGIPVVEKYEITAMWPKERGLSRPLRALTQLLGARVGIK